jgi:WD40 repeat protein
MVLSTGDDQSVRVWDLQAATGIQQFNLSVPVFNARFHPDGTCFAAGTADFKAKLWDLRSQRVLQVHSGHNDLVTAVDFHPNGNFLISSSKDSSVKIWDLRQGNCLYTLLGHQGSAACLKFGKNGESFVSGGGDSAVLLWKAHAVQKEFVKKRGGKEEASRSEKVSEQLAGTLDKLVSQLDIVTRTIVMLDQRISNFEDNIEKLTERIMGDE